jgi:hypothetical protein
VLTVPKYKRISQKITHFKMQRPPDAFHSINPGRQINSHYSGISASSCTYISARRIGVELAGGVDTDEAHNSAKLVAGKADECRHDSRADQWFAARRRGFNHGVIKEVI